MDFYKQGQVAAFEKTALARILAGTAAGAGIGALTAGEGRRGRGALVGGALGGLSSGFMPRIAAQGNKEILQNFREVPLGVYAGLGGITGIGSGLMGGLGTRFIADSPAEIEAKRKALLQQTQSTTKTSGAIRDYLSKALTRQASKALSRSSIYALPDTEQQLREALLEPSLQWLKKHPPLEPPNKNPLINRIKDLFQEHPIAASTGTALAGSAGLGAGIVGLQALHERKMKEAD